MILYTSQLHCSLRLTPHSICLVSRFGDSQSHVCAHRFLLYKHVSPECTGLTCCVSINPHIEALEVSTGITYCTVEDSCCGSPRVTVEMYCSRASRPSSVECSINAFCFTSIRKVPPSITRKAAVVSSSCAEQSSTTSPNIRDFHNTVVGILHTVQS